MRLSKMDYIKKNRTKIVIFFRCIFLARNIIKRLFMSKRSTDEAPSSKRADGSSRELVHVVGQCTWG